MKPKNFPEANCVLHPPAGMTDCDDLDVYRDGRTVVSCWRLSLADRVKLLLSGELWLGIIGGRTQPPVWLSADCPFKRPQPVLEPVTAEPKAVPAGIQPSEPWPRA